MGIVFLPCLGFVHLSWSIISTSVWSQGHCDGSKFRQQLWVDAKICLEFGYRMPNIQLNHPFNIVFVRCEQTWHLSNAQLCHTQMFLFQMSHTYSIDMPEFSNISPCFILLSARILLSIFSRIEIVLFIIWWAIHHTHHLFGLSNPF